ncbi:hypothetical protein D0907_12755 [Pseudoalteromonas lipolytica]|jgi:hypothetical protein|uniref:Uncharacterized protein n=1 Tax=Pseudoalteromonas lipolytica TaxID=570156 RepID=A0AAD0S110_9GAMM|nr:MULTISPECIES: hypothetical protein [Pseudoalteromonas]AXV66080.1 hypothetical protein D0907_12755 [Pseudoalteromonas donghaensis]EWH08020.1 hypothetical protein AT00_00855 [Pseudoalteromonas lipolytica SCSIO 04301]MBE0350430.1 hypothetical protein [Pseudoalteromonas lipolytica LMEB 39]MCC9660175.1 hypothetical protein [Pseudoalteromonas sp. MB41]QLJ07601.1 hypothetical protein GZH31_12525 [Pseudoalteromonas sp. JSTW]
MLAKPLYEAAPYGYFILGISCITLANNVVPTVIGIVLFLLGANIWRMRSNARRTDHSSQRVNQRKLYYYYEFKPFIVFIAAYTLIQWTQNELVSVIGVLLCITAVVILVMRILNRHSHSILH